MLYIFFLSEEAPLILISVCVHFLLWYETVNFVLHERLICLDPPLQTLYICHFCHEITQHTWSQPILIFHVFLSVKSKAGLK